MHVTQAVDVIATPVPDAHVVVVVVGDSYFSMNKKTLVISVVAVVVLIAIGLFVEFFTGFAPWPIGDNAKAKQAHPYTSLAKGNSTFVQADYLRSTGDFAGAINLYQKALANISDPSQEAIVLLRMGRAYAAQGNYALSIQTFKGVVTNQARYPALYRAYAAESMGDEYFQYSGNSAITAEIFKDEPFKSMYVQGDDFLSYRHLYEYTVSIYPMAIAELNIANWYAVSIDTMSPADQKGATSTAYMAVIKQTFDAANKDAPRLLDNVLPTEALRSAIIRATVLGKLSIAGNESLGEPENAFKYAISQYQATKNADNDGRVRLQYAIFLDRKYGASRAKDIQNILAPIYTEPRSKQRSINIDSFLTSGLQGVRRQQYIALSAVDPNFKALLITLGWPTSAFK